MTVVQTINSAQNSNKPLLNTANTGYTAAGGLVLSTFSGMSKSKGIKKFHKPLVFLTIIATLSHILTIFSTRKKYSNSETII